MLFHSWEGAAQVGSFFICAHVGERFLAATKAQSILFRLRKADSTIDGESQPEAGQRETHPPALCTMSMHGARELIL